MTRQIPRLYASVVFIVKSNSCSYYILSGIVLRFENLILHRIRNLKGWGDFLCTYYILVFSQPIKVAKLRDGFRIRRAKRNHKHFLFKTERIFKHIYVVISC